MARIKIKFFKLADGTCRITQWLDGIRPLKAQAKVIARIQLLEELGHEIRRPHADMVDEGIYELRERFIHVQYRLMFFFHRQGEAVITHGFTKPTAAIDPREIQQAKRYRAMFLKNPEKHTYEE